MARKDRTRVVIVGAGPVGLLTALMLGRCGIEVDVLETALEIDMRPRGAAYGPPAVNVLKRAGVIDKVLAAGMEANEICWRQLGGSYITGIERLNDRSFTDRTIILPVHILAGILNEEVKVLSNVKVYWGHKFSSLSQDESSVTIQAETDGDIKPFHADFVVGCDGGRSSVRKALFNDSFPGYTWDMQLVATNIRYDGFEKHGWSDVQWIIHPEHWALACRLDKKGLWRVAYGEPAGLNVAQLRQGLAAKFETILPGNPKPGEYELLRWSPFVMHQRCVEKMRVGRMLLAGDAAHLCNPMGGLGLTGGIADVGSLIDCLQGIHEGRTSLKILDVYDKKRREIYHNVIDPMSSSNLRRMFQDGSTALEKDPILQYINFASKETAETAKLLHVASNLPLSPGRIKLILLQMQDALTADLTEFYDLG
ncbi:uncharacterized protein A1O9_09537 [Exophiala aquamarina CBS 119918]|uniref:FAD-binding domain-containing protein n=1 Tax=Exophiala aquamarina CBS 119918 TaxID=1182545 RepID=A0A072P3F9_9EURO|nr:uncharacterized protein A1O9_09537 [Exophiala aquamarina CBS 119918]KEF54371.1 hypothetical protein A1O9_09537 [Exophiala aquamarina CBS 119918]